MRRILVIFFVLIAFAIVTLAAPTLDEKHKRSLHHNHHHHHHHRNHKHHKRNNDHEHCCCCCCCCEHEGEPVVVTVTTTVVAKFTPVTPPEVECTTSKKSKPTKVTPTAACTTTTKSSTTTPTTPAQANNDICKTSKKDLSIGTQKRDGECSDTVQGEIPNVNHMVSTLIIEPAFGSVQKANTPFTVVIVSTGLHTGVASNPKSEYFAFPQKLDENGLILGNYFVTVQKLDSVVEPPDARRPVFYRLIECPANNKDQLSAEVDGLTTGLYRICAISASKSHQPLLMPVAQRGAQNDCIRITVK